MLVRTTGLIWRRHAVLLVALALGLRILVPSGWMPAADRVGLMPCFGTAPAASAHNGMMAHHAAPDRERHDKDDPADKPCAFVSFACALAEPGGPAEALASASRPIMLPILVATVTIGAGLAAPPPPPTGPPAKA